MTELLRLEIPLTLVSCINACKEQQQQQTISEQQKQIDISFLRVSYL